MQIQQRITPFLSFPSQAQEAAQFYVSVFPDAKILRTLTNPGSEAVLTVEFELLGMKFVTLNTGQDWKFTEATSFSIACDTQSELDQLWSRLSGDGGREIACAWLQDKFGVFWQLVPTKLNEWFASGDPDRVARVLEQVWQMTKLDIAKLQSAYDGVQ